MKKLLTALLTGTTIIFLTACSSAISQADYDAILKENDSLKNENTLLSTQVEKLEAEKLELAKSTATLISETTEIQLQDLDSEYNEKYIKLITDQIFGENCDFVTSNTTLHINTYYDQEYSYELYQKMVDDCITFSVLYWNTLPSVPDGLLAFDYITTYCWDKNSNRVISILFSPKDDGLQLADVMLNAQYAYDIVEKASK